MRRGCKGARGGARGCRGEEGKGHHHIADTEAACGGDEAHGGEHEGDRGVTLAQHAYGDGDAAEGHQVGVEAFDTRGMGLGLELGLGIRSTVVWN